eukprot:sb/3467057/
MRIKVTRDSVIDKLHPSEKSPKHKKIPAALRSKTPEKSRKAHGVSPRQRKNSLKAPSPSTSGGRKSRARAVNLIKLFDAENKSKESTAVTKEQKEQKKVNRKQKTLDQCVIEQDKITLPPPEECPILPDRPEHSVSLVSMKVDTTLSADTPPPVKIRRGWKKHIPKGLGYKLFGPDSPAKPPPSPANLAVRLCFLGKIDDASIRCFNPIPDLLPIKTSLPRKLGQRGGPLLHTHRQDFTQKTHKNGGLFGNCHLCLQLSRRSDYLSLSLLSLSLYLSISFSLFIGILHISLSLSISLSPSCNTWRGKNVQK